MSGRHLAFIFEIDVVARVHDLHRVADALQEAALGIAEIGIGQEGDARLMAHPPRHGGGLDRDLGELRAGRPLGHRRVGDEDGVRLADHQVDAERGDALLRVEHAADLAIALRIGPGDAGDHHVGLAHGEQKRAEDVAVLVDRPLELAVHVAAPLQAIVEIVRHLGGARMVAAVVDLEALRILDAERLQPVVDVVAADQHRNAVAAVAEGDRGAQHDILLALGEEDAARIGARRFISERQHRGGRIEPGAQRGAIGGHVGDRLARDARIHRRLRDRGGDDFHQPRDRRARG